MTAGHDDDEPETFACYRHPDRETALRCSNCDRPICVDCAVQSPVGIKCPDCARVPRAARGVVPTSGLVRGLLAALGASVVIGFVLTVVNVPFLGIILAYAGGLGIGELTRRASGGYRDPMLARVAATAAVVGMLALPVIRVIAAGGGHTQYLVWSIVAAGFAAVGAYRNAS
jgi:hypothetical protein